MVSSMLSEESLDDDDDPELLSEPLPELPPDVLPAVGAAVVEVGIGTPRLAAQSARLWPYMVLVWLRM